MAQQSRTRTMVWLLSAGLAVAASLGSSACSSSSANGGAGNNPGGQDTGDASGITEDLAADGAVIGCSTDPRTEPFAIGLKHQGSSKVMSFVISGATYSPPATANNTWTLQVLDASGQPVTDAALTFPSTGHPSDPWMPDHSHGDVAAAATNNHDGTYTVTPLYFFMPGVWSTYVVATTATATDSTTFTFCIGG